MPLEWGTQQDWEDATKTNIEVVNDTFQLATAIPDSVVYDFETGDTSRWDAVNNLAAVTNRVYAGSYSGYCGITQSGTHQARVTPDGYGGGQQPSEFEFYWNESSGSFGGGIRLFNSDGNVEVGLATNNPQWDIDDGNGANNVDGGDGTDHWTRFTITFDWTSETFDADFENLDTGHTYTDADRPLKNGNDIERIQIENYTDRGWQGSGSIDMWFDDITITL